MNPNAKQPDVVEATLLHDDRWQDIEDAARSVERAVEGVLPEPELAQVRNVSAKVQRAAQVGREVEALAHDVTDAVHKLEERIGGSIFRYRTHPRG